MVGLTFLPKIQAKSLSDEMVEKTYIGSRKANRPEIADESRRAQINAEEEIKKGIQRVRDCPRDSSSHYELGKLYVLRNDVRRAEKHFLLALEYASSDSQRVSYCFELANLYERQQKNAEAEKYLQKTISFSKSEPLYWRYYAEFLDRQGRSEDATEARRKFEGNSDRFPPDLK